MAKQFDYLVVGAGLYGSTFARIATDKGKSCIVIDKRNHIAGNCYTEKCHNIDVHKYGAHLFHTNDKEVWDFVNRFSEFNQYRHQVIVKSGNVHYSFPPNKMTYQQLGTTNKQVLYKKLFKGYTEKMWGKERKDVIRRIPIRNDWDNKYFSDKYQGIPIDGYTKLVERMLTGIKVQLNCPFRWDQITTKKIVYSGPIDSLFGFMYGRLPYKSLCFKTKMYNKKQVQGIGVINYADKDVPYIRTVEHKYFNWIESRRTIVTTEYSTEQGEEFYPILDSENINLYNKYKKLLSNDFILGGRLGSYRYMDMDEVVKQAIEHTNRISR